MSTTTKFSLSEFVRAVHNETHEIHPDKLVQAVITALADAPQADRDSALEQALRSFCQHTLNNIRRSPHVFPGDQRRTDAHSSSVAGGPTPNSARSWKTRGAAEYWRAALDRPFWDGADTWVVFGELTADALDRMTEWHTTLADANRAKATEMHEWAQLLREHKVVMIKDLPEAVLRERLSKADAA